MLSKDIHVYYDDGGILRYFIGSKAPDISVYSCPGYTKFKSPRYKCLSVSEIYEVQKPQI